MKKKHSNSHLFISLTLILIGFGVSCEQLNSTQKQSEIKTRMDSISYIVGANLAYQSNGVDLNADMIYRGYVDAKDTTGSVISQAEANKLMAAFSLELQTEQAKRLQMEAASNEIIGGKFLEKNREKEGVQESASGLQYIILEEGEGETPNINSIVTTQFTGTLIDGTIFDTTQDNGPSPGPRQVEVAKVIEGWREALLQMKPGAKWKLFIPPSLGYGKDLRDPIPPNSVLIFDLELIDVKNPAQ